jgi:hypothetical protein
VIVRGTVLEIAAGTGRSAEFAAYEEEGRLRARGRLHLAAVHDERRA